MKKFEDLVFEDHSILKKRSVDAIRLRGSYFKGSLQAKLEFDNGENISVIFGKMFYSNGIDTYEAYASNEDEPRGYLTKDEVTAMMKEIQKGSHE